MKYDEFTGTYISDEEEDVQKFNDKIPENKTELTSSIEEKENYIEEKVPKLNKKVIIVCAVSILVLLMFLGLFKGEKKEKENKERKQASDIIIPNFGDYQNRGYQSIDNILDKNNQIPQEKVKENTDILPEKYKTVSENPEKKTRPVQTTYNPIISEEELKARTSPLTAKLNKENANKSLNSTTSTYTTNSYPISSISQNDYIQDRLGNLSNYSSSNSYESQNMQGNKNSFYKQNQDSIVSGYYIAKDTIWTGTVIPAVLLTGINTDGPGQIKAQVTENVFDSLTGKILLIPQGTILIAEYNSSISYAQKRVQIAWNTLIRPDGYQLNLGNMNGIDKEGFSGVAGRIDDHFFEYVKAMGIISIFTAINGEFDNQIKAMENEYAANLLQQNQTVINQLGSKLIDRALDIQPTIIKKNGEQVNLFVNKNISLPPFKR